MIRPQYCAGQVKDPNHPTARKGMRRCNRFRWADPEQPESCGTAQPIVEPSSRRTLMIDLSQICAQIDAVTAEIKIAPDPAAVRRWTIPSGAWKRRTVGVGNATKPQVRAWVDRLGVAVRLQDEADAVAIACAGRAMLIARSWEAAA